MIVPCEPENKSTGRTGIRNGNHTFHQVALICRNSTHYANFKILGPGCGAKQDAQAEDQKMLVVLFHKMRSRMVKMVRLFIWCDKNNFSLYRGICKQNFMLHV